MRFKAFLALSRIKQLKPGLFYKKLGTQQRLVYNVVWKWLDLKIIVICQKLGVKLRFFAFFRFFGTFGPKIAQTWFVLHETLHRTLFGIYYCIAMVRIEHNGNMLEITCQVGNLCILKLFWHFRALSSSNLVLLYETWHTTLFGIYYCVEVVRFEKDSHMLEITC